MECKMLADLFGKDLSDLTSKKLFLFDMDGTIYKENTLFKGTLDLLRAIDNCNGKYVFITNNSSRSVRDYISKVDRLGIKADVNNFFTSAQATVLYLKEKYPNKKVYCQGTDSLVNELINSGINTTVEVENDVDVILVGFDTELTSLKLRKTCELLQRDIPYIATNPDLRCPVDFGYIPDCGSICNMLFAATGRTPFYIGKPEPVMVDFVRKKFHSSKEETVVIGDRLYTDIASGINAGVTSICVLTGESTVTDIQNGNIAPTYVFNSVFDIYQALMELH